MQIDRLWAKTDSVFRSDISDDVADIWLSQLSAHSFVDGELILTGPERARSWVDLRYRRALTRCATSAAGETVEVRLLSSDELPADDTQPTAAEQSSPSLGTPLNPRYVFGQFVIGEANQIAHAAALAVAEQPAQAFNPLFVYGAPGVGKTHLLQAIGNFMAEQAPDLSVRYLTAENFAAIFRSVVLKKTVQDFKEDLRRTDVLLIDDVQFLQNKVKTEEEFFHTFNHLYESGRQLVISCDRTPRNLESLSERMRERFESGLVVEVERPGANLREAILKKRVQLDNIPVDDPRVLERIAERSPDNVRSLEGALIRVSAFASLRGEPITPELVDQLLDSLHPGSSETAGEQRRSPVAIDLITRVVADHFELSVDELMGKGRARRVSGPRQIAMYLACEHSGQSLPMIAKAFNRDHSTIVHARDKVRQERKRDRAAADVVDSLRAVIHRGA